MTAMAGNSFWFSTGPAVLGLSIHMMTGAMFGIGFAFLAHRIPRAVLVPAGATYGLTVIADMASMVGWARFAVEHMIFGLALGVLALPTAPAENDPAGIVGPRSTMLSR